MRLLVVVVVLVGCSKKEETRPPEPEGSGSAVVVDAEPPPPTEIEGVPVAIALPKDYGVFQEIAMDAERVFVIASDVLVVPRSGGVPKVLVDIEVDDSTGTSLVKPENEAQLRQMTADRPDVAD